MQIDRNLRSHCYFGLMMYLDKRGAGRSSELTLGLSKTGVIRDTSYFYSDSKLPRQVTPA